MLLSFSVENFRSIKERQTIDLGIASLGKNQKKPKAKDLFNALPTLAFYGANASGKSNILKALYAVDYLVRRSDSFKLDDTIGYHEPFRLDKGNEKLPTKFELDFVAKNKIKYSYKISFNSSHFISESLLYYPKGQKSLLFQRQYNKPIKYGSHLKGNKKNIESQLLPNQLFLSKAANNKIEQLQQPYSFFRHQLLTHFNQRDDITDTVLNTLSKVLPKDAKGNLTEKINKIIHIADIGIDSFYAIKRDEEEFGFPSDFPEEKKKEVIEKFEYKLYTKHKLNSSDKKNKELVEFSLEDESAGTQKLIAISTIVFPILESGSTFVVDELDNSLHPLLTRVLIRLFNNRKINKHGAQLIFSTHDSSLLSDSSLLERQSIYFTEKTPTGETTVYSLNDIKGVRKDIPLDKWYLSGRFGAIPSIDDLESLFCD